MSYIAKIIGYVNCEVHSEIVMLYSYINSYMYTIYMCMYSFIYQSDCFIGYACNHGDTNPNGI